MANLPQRDQDRLFVLDEDGNPRRDRRAGGIAISRNIQPIDRPRLRRRAEVLVAVAVLADGVDRHLSDDA